MNLWLLFKKGPTSKTVQPEPIRIFGKKYLHLEYTDRPGAYAVIYNRFGEVALAKSEEGYFLPGGGLESRETLEQCLLREALEELGWQIRILGPIGRADQYCLSSDLGPLRKQGFFYLAEKIADPILVSKPEHQAIWLRPDIAMETLLHASQAWAIQQTRHTSAHRHRHMLGQLRYHSDFSSDYLKPDRTIIVYLPPEYGHNKHDRHPVLYMHDGNNLFDSATGFMGKEWQLDATLEQLDQVNRIQTPIVVGIYNTPDRTDEYTWHPMIFDGHIQGGWGSQYARFLVEELKPFIDKTYRTLRDREHTAMMGSSFGALISFYTAQAYPHIFSKVGLMSPTVYWANHQILKDVKEFPKNMKIWVDIGTEEGRDPDTEETVESTLALVKALENQGYVRHENLGFYIDHGAGHYEEAWGNRVSKPLCFFFGIF